jgi:hypothetical protein
MLQGKKFDKRSEEFEKIKMYKGMMKRQGIKEEEEAEVDKITHKKQQKSAEED